MFQAKRLKDLEKENTRLKKLVADALAPLSELERQASAPPAKRGGAKGPEAVLPILQTLKQEVLRLEKDYPQLAKARAVGR